MVGGKVIGLVKNADRYLLSVRDTNGDECAVRCGLVNLKTGEPVSIGLEDQVWWQCGKVYWTAKSTGERPNPPEDVPIKKIGYSH
jgi:hypothetical protein